MKFKNYPEGRPKRVVASDYAPILRTESLSEFESLLHVFDLEVRGHNTIEVFFLEQAMKLIWRIRRYERLIEAILNNAMRPALENLLTRLGEGRPTNYDPKDLARDWLTDEEAKQTVLKTLEEAGLDESTIELEAWRMVAGEVEALDRLVSSSMSQLERSLRMVVQYAHLFSRKGRGMLEEIQEETQERRLSRRRR
jgi:hypothetical protein